MLPSEPDLKSFISSWCITAGAQWGFDPGAGACLVYSRLFFMARFWRWQCELGADHGKGVSLLDSYTRYLFNIGRK